MEVTVSRFSAIGVIAASLLLVLAVYHHHLDQQTPTFLMSTGLTRALVVTEQANVRTLQAPQTRYVGNNGDDIFPLGLCEGDCDSDDDCEGSLVCQERDPGDDLHGCSLGAIDRNSPADFCVQKQPSNGGHGARNGHGTSLVLQAPQTRYVGNNGDDIFPLGLCEGDCDSDDDCEGSLVCQERDPGDDLPGCSLGAIDRNSPADFCVQKKPADPFNGGNGAGNGNDKSPAVSTGVESFALKLYWQEGYFWQEETVERKWCMYCRDGCFKYSTISITTCDVWGNTQWSLIIHDTTGQEAQIRVSDQLLCMEADTDYRDIFLTTCDPSEEKQRFIAQGGNFLYSDRFEISPKVMPEWCLTQIHHPKEDEKVYIRPCPYARRDDTSYWNKY